MADEILWDIGTSVNPRGFYNSDSKSQIKYFDSQQ